MHGGVGEGPGLVLRVATTTTTSLLSYAKHTFMSEHTSSPCAIRGIYLNKDVAPFRIIMVHHIWVAVVVIVGVVTTIFDSDCESHLHYCMLMQGMQGCKRSPR